MNVNSIQTVLNFWFDKNHKPLCFAKNKCFDDLIKNKFSATYQATIYNKYDNWKEIPHGALTLTIIFDQFPRNMLRDNKKAFSTENQALNLSKFAIAKKMDAELLNDYKYFLYMPFMHSENLQDQEISSHLFQNNNYAQWHYNIIKKFGRFPHRNKILKRISTAKETEFLLQPNSSF